MNWPMAVANIGSLLILATVVGTVYTLSLDLESSPRALVRRSARRVGKLLGILAALAVVVLALSGF